MGRSCPQTPLHRHQRKATPSGLPGVIRSEYLVMDIVTREHLEFLSVARNHFCVSIFLPTHRAGKEIQQDSVRLKNLLREAEAELMRNGIRKLKAGELLAPAQQLQARAGFWRYQSDGLALFLAPGFFQYLRLPLNFHEFLSVEERFQIQPLLPLFTAGGRFYLLAFSKKQVRVFEGSDYSLSTIELDGIPRSMREMMKYEVHEGLYNVHSGGGYPSAKKKEVGVFHGQGGGLDDSEAKLLNYCQLIDRGLHRLLRSETAPLVIAAVQEAASVYRRANTYNHLIPGVIEGNPDLLRELELHRAAWNVLRPHFEQARNQALASYNELAGSPRVSNLLKETLLAAHQGRILSVILPLNVQRWGRYNFEQDELIGHDERQPGDEDLLNLIAIQTILHDGAVYAMAPEEMPEYSVAAAVFRY